MLITSRMTNDVLQKYDASIEDMTQELLSKLATKIEDTYTQLKLSFQTGSESDYDNATSLNPATSSKLVSMLKGMLDPYLPPYFWEQGVSGKERDVASAQKLEEVLHKAIKQMHLDLRVFFKKALGTAIRREYERSLFRVYLKDPKKQPVVVGGFLSDKHHMNKQTAIDLIIKDLEEAGEKDMAEKMKVKTNWMAATPKATDVPETSPLTGRKQPGGFYLSQTYVRPFSSLADIGFSTGSGKEDRDRQIYDLMVQMLVDFKSHPDKLEDALVKAFRSPQEMNSMSLEVKPEISPEEIETDTTKTPDNIKGRVRKETEERKEKLQDISELDKLQRSGATQAVFEPKHSPQATLEYIREKIDIPESAMTGAEMDPTQAGKHLRYAPDTNALNYLAHKRANGELVEWQYVAVHVRPKHTQKKEKDTVKMLEFRIPELSDDESFMIEIPPVIGFVRSVRPGGRVDYKARDVDDLKEYLEGKASYKFRVVKVRDDYAILDFVDFKDQVTQRTLKQVADPESGGINATQLKNFFTYMTYDWINGIAAKHPNEIAAMLGQSLTLMGRQIPAGEQLSDIAMGELQGEVDRIRQKDQSYTMYKDLEETRTQETYMQQAPEDLLGHNVAAVVKGLDTADADRVARTFVHNLPNRIMTPSLSLKAAFMTAPFMHWLVSLITDKNSPIRVPRQPTEDRPDKEEDVLRRIPWRLMINEVIESERYPQDPIHRGFLESVYAVMVSENPDMGNDEKEALLKQYHTGKLRLSPENVKQVLSYLKAKHAAITGNVIPVLANYLVNGLVDLVASGNPLMKGIIEKAQGGIREGMKPILEKARQAEAQLKQELDRVYMAVVKKDTTTLKEMFDTLYGKNPEKSNLQQLFLDVYNMNVDEDLPIKEQPEVADMARRLTKIYEMEYRRKAHMGRNTEIERLMKQRKPQPPASIDEAERARLTMTERAKGPAGRRPAVPTPGPTPASVPVTAAQDLYLMLRSGRPLEISFEKNGDTYKNAVKMAMSNLRRQEMFVR